MLQRNSTDVFPPSINSTHSPDSTDDKTDSTIRTVDGVQPPRRYASNIGMSCLGISICRMRHFKTFVAGVATLLSGLIVAYFTIRNRN